MRSRDPPRSPGGCGANPTEPYRKPRFAPLSPQCSHRSLPQLRTPAPCSPGSGHMPRPQCFHCSSLLASSILVASDGHIHVSTQSSCKHAPLRGEPARSRSGPAPRLATATLLPPPPPRTCHWHTRPAPASAAAARPSRPRRRGPGRLRRRAPSRRYCTAAAAGRAPPCAAAGRAAPPCGLAAMPRPLHGQGTDQLHDVPALVPLSACVQHVMH